MFLLLEIAGDQGKILVPFEAIEFIGDIRDSTRNEFDTNGNSVLHLKAGPSLIDMSQEVGYSKTFFLKHSASDVFLMIQNSLLENTRWQPAPQVEP